jgi:iron-sulfur cluster repair protein YtfE (RIC family)
VNDPIAMLKKDHREVAELLKRLAASKPGPRRRTVVTKLASDLQLHMQFEEAEIYPLLADRIGEEPAEEATIEHGLARRGVEQLRELVDAPGFGAVVAMLTAGIRHHVKEEEAELFPKLKKQLDRETLIRLGDDYAAQKRDARRVRQ